MKSNFLKIKPCTVLLLLKDSQQQWYASKLARAAACSYVHTANLLSVLKKNGVVELEKKGRQGVYRLTERGAYLALALDDFSKKCDSMQAEAKEKQAAQPAEKAAASHPAHAQNEQKPEKQQ